MASWMDIRVGQTWRSRDPRDHGRTVIVIEAPSGQMGHVVVRSVRKSRMRPSTLLTRYELAKDAPR